MEAVLLFREKRLEADGSIIEMTIWGVASPVPPSTHRLKYSLFYGRPGRRLVGFDNERGKGDHIHVGDREQPYRFVSMEQLVADFLIEVAKAETGDE